MLACGGGRGKPARLSDAAAVSAPLGAPHGGWAPERDAAAVVRRAWRGPACPPAAEAEAEPARTT